MNYKIGTRLGATFAAVILIGMATALYGRMTLGNVSSAMNRLLDDSVMKVTQLRDIKDEINVVARAVRNIVLLSDSKSIQAEDNRITESREKMNAVLKRLQSTSMNEKERALVKAAVDALTANSAAVDRVVELGVANRDEEAAAMLMNEARALQRTTFSTLEEAISYEREQMTKANDEVKAQAQRAGLLMLMLAGLATIIGASLAWLTTRSIVRPIQQAVHVANTVAAGDLSSRIDVSRDDETGQLLAALKQMNGRLVEIVSAVRTSSDSIAVGSAQIAMGNADLSRRTEEQASNLQQTAASMEELTSAVKQNADTAQQASQLAVSASGVAQQGGAVVRDVVQMMEQITASSRRIADIIAVIDGIAFQTNILALNAAVEAARAGEQGRGFAVVASEVRNLAQRSAQAAKEIKVLIAESVERVELGSTLVVNAGQTMDGIVSHVDRVSALISEITTASVEQSTGIGQVGEAVAQLDTTTQHNAALVEESAAAAESLRLQSVRLMEAMSVFKIDPA